MNRIFQIIVQLSVLILLANCCGCRKEKPIWEDIKLRDLRAASNKNNDKLLHTANFDIYTFEIPAEDANSLTGLWQQLYLQPLHFSNHDAFNANFFRIGFGQNSIWQKISRILQTVNAKKTKTVSLLLFDGQKDDVYTKRLTEKQTVFYFSRPNRIKEVSLGPGLLGLRIKAEKIVGLKGVCNLTAQPVFTIRMKYSGRNMVSRNEFHFKDITFSLKMSPGDFVILGPEEYHDDNVTLASLFFSQETFQPIVKIYMIACTGMNY